MFTALCKLELYTYQERWAWQSQNVFDVTKIAILLQVVLIFDATSVGIDKKSKIFKIFWNK